MNKDIKMQLPIKEEDKNVTAGVKNLSIAYQNTIGVKRHNISSAMASTRFNEQTHQNEFVTKKRRAEARHWFQSILINKYIKMKLLLKDK